MCPPSKGTKCWDPVAIASSPAAQWPRYSARNAAGRLRRIETSARNRRRRSESPTVMCHPPDAGSSRTPPRPQVERQRVMGNGSRPAARSVAGDDHILRRTDLDMLRPVQPDGQSGGLIQRDRQRDRAEAHRIRPRHLRAGMPQCQVRHGNGGGIRPSAALRAGPTPRPIPRPCALRPMSAARRAGGETAICQ